LSEQGAINYRALFVLGLCIGRAGTPTATEIFNRTENLMRSLLLAVLILAAAASAQPLQGPFTVLEISAPYNITSPHLVLRDNTTADLFYQMADTVYHATVSLSNGALVSRPQAMPPASGFVRRLCDAIWTDSGWVAMVYDDNEPGNWNRTAVYRGQDTVLASHEIDSGRNYSISQWFGCSINSSLTLAARDNGQFVAAWSDYSEAWMYGGWFGEFWVDGGVYSFSGNQIRSTGSVFGALDSLFLCNIGPDSLLSLGNRWGDLSICSLLSESFITHCDEYYTSYHPISFLPTRGGQYFMLSQTDSARLIELGEGTVRERLCMDGVPIASSPSRDHGMTWLSKLGEELYLYRIDTLTMEHFPAGQLYVPAGTHQVADAHMDIKPAGTIAVCWTERPAPGTSANTIKIASLGWNTALGTEVPHSILPPSAITLSAYPNPFNSTLRVEYSLPSAARGELAMYNLLGQKVAVLKDGTLEAGNAAVNWTPEGAGGIYFAVLKTATQSRTAKVVYLK
jgi:hypothetical protein